MPFRRIRSFSAPLSFRAANRKSCGVACEGEACLLAATSSKRLASLAEAPSPPVCETAKLRDTAQECSASGAPTRYSSRAVGLRWLSQQACQVPAPLPVYSSARQVLQSLGVFFGLSPVLWKSSSKSGHRSSIGQPSLP